MGFEQGVNLSDDHLVALLGLYRTSTNHFFAFKPRHFMEIIKCFSNDSSRWREYFFFVRLDRASVAEGCLPSFKRRWGRIFKTVLISLLILPLLTPLIFIFGSWRSIHRFPEDLFDVRTIYIMVIFPKTFMNVKKL